MDVINIVFVEICMLRTCKVTFRKGEIRKINLITLRSYNYILHLRFLMFLL